MLGEKTAAGSVAGWVSMGARDSEGHCDCAGAFALEVRESPAKSAAGLGWAGWAGWGRSILRELPETSSIGWPYIIRRRACAIAIVAAIAAAPLPSLARARALRIGQGRRETGEKSRARVDVGCMSEVVAPGQPTTEARRGRKRAADASLESEQRLSKRFDLLNLGRPYIHTHLPIEPPRR